MAFLRAFGLLGLLAVLIGAAGCGGSATTRGSIPTLDPAALPPLPQQGLIVAKTGSVLLETTGGGVVGRLVGFSMSPPQDLTSREFAWSTGIEALQRADPRLTVLFDRSGAGWILDVPNRRLSRIVKLEAPLAAGADVRIIVTGNPSTGINTKTLIERNGVKVLEGLSVSVIGARYAVTTYDLGAQPTKLLDLVTNRSVTLKPHCDAIGVVGENVFATCIPSLASQPSTLELFRGDGTQRVLSTFVPNLVPESAFLSPNGKWVLLYLAPGCGPGWAAVASTGGGTARFVAGGGTVSEMSSAPRFSAGLGWTTGNKIVATIAGTKPSSCEGESSAGTFLIDPATLSRTRSTPAFAGALWGSSS
jgi:hypothetical protein